MKYKHALFLNPYIESTATSIMGLFPPTGLEYVATSAKGFVEKLTLLDLRYEKHLSEADNLLGFISKNAIDIICVGISWDRQFTEICSLINLMPPEIPLVVGGYKATEQVQELFNICTNINIIVRGEGEESIKDVMKGLPLENILGISYRKDGTIIHNPGRPLVDIDHIPYPDRSLRRNKYRMILNGVSVTNLTYDSVLSARGCPYNCKFCTFSLNPLGQKRTYAARCAKSVVEEIEKLTAKIILFSDDNFCASIKRAEEICDLIIQRKVKKRFMAQARIEIARHPELLKKMVKAGFKIILLGIESPHDRILSQLNKGFNPDDVRDAFRILRKIPMYYHGYFIYGNIGETEEEMLQIADFAKEINVDSITFQKLRIEKFSMLKELAEKTPGYHVTQKGELYSDMYSHAALKKIARRIKFSFYTPLRLLKIARKALAIRLVTFWEILSSLAAGPRLLIAIAAREIYKKRFGNTLKRIFIRNA